MGPDRGFSLIELLLAAAVMLVVTAALLGLLTQAQGIYVAHQEVADMQQRLRAAYDAIDDDLGSAGADGERASPDRSLASSLPSIRPFRPGLRRPDPPASFKPDVLTVLYAPAGAAQATIRQAMPARGDVVTVNLDSGCPAGDPVCGFTPDTDVAILGRDGAFDTFTITSITPPRLALRHNEPDWSTIYPPGSPIVQIVTRTFYLRADAPGHPPQLMRYDGGIRPDVPVIDNVASLSFEYFAEPAPPRMIRPLSDRRGPWTTYGPPPPVEGSASRPFRAGTNCVFAANGSELATPRLAALGVTGGALVLQSADRFTDGPWCPDDTAPNRFDADLLRVRSVGVSLRIESALDALRGPAGLLFARAGTATAATRSVPDMPIHFRVTPASLVSGR